ncbi:MAG: hypothetical protein J5J06_08380 [Phycisphaerae bacterium]|nr:hypothetical protein [Phycisphaerae bacterium]
MTEVALEQDWKSQVSGEVIPGIARLAEFVQAVFADVVEALVLFGPAVSSEFHPGIDRARTVLVLRNVELAGLRRLATEIPGLTNQGVAAPLIMTPAYIDESRDTFPLEFLEVQQRHVIVLGRDPFSNLTFLDADIRTQCEREVKILMIGLRQGLLASGGADDDLVDLDHDVASGLVRTLRGVLWLKGTRDALSTKDILTHVEGVVGRKLDGLRKSLQPEARERWDEFVRLYDDVAAVGRFIDELQTN